MCYFNINSRKRLTLVEVLSLYDVTLLYTLKHGLMSFIVASFKGVIFCYSIKGRLSEILMVSFKISNFHQ